ncbi:MAG: tRNA (N6-isopentenyl adenosine(37)-C2)-methylthiotransferase MiaB [Synergistaceae bacterium]|nr:tRNA (N6-isopentenyl adenosine(37)-C2)-methylthiotransferase MiaB [Synergistaceae bacterium]
MPEKFFSIKVFGCQMNAYDGDRLRGAMTGRGWRETDDVFGSDFAIFVTCCIRDKAEQKVLSELGRFRASWERKGRPRIALLGCMAERAGAELPKRFPWVRVVAGPRRLGAVPDAITDAYENGRVRVIPSAGPRALDDLYCAPVPNANRHKAYVTIAHGCDQFCSYCIVPHVRGRFASRDPDEIIREASSLVEGGVKEITLLGQNVNTYGRDFVDGRSGCRFSNLLSDVASLKGLRRLRFTTSHPVDFTDDILDVMSGGGVICPSINLPVQAGSDKVLREMNRRYTRAEYLALIGRVRDALPGAAITTDLIVGFPGETEREFEESVSLLEEVRFDLAHTAAYSPREGTPAAARDDQVPAGEKARRLVRVNEVQALISRAINKSMEGRTFEVMLDEAAPRGEGLLQGRTVTDKVVLVRAPGEMEGSIRGVRVTASTPWCLEGDLT